MLGPSFWKKYFQVYDTLNHSPIYEDLVKSVTDATNIEPGMYVFDADEGTGNVSMEVQKIGKKGGEWMFPNLPPNTAEEATPTPLSLGKIKIF